MDETENPDYLRLLAGKTHDFLEAFQHLLEMSTFIPLRLLAESPGLPAIVARSMSPEGGPSEHWIAARASASRAAGRVSDVARLTGVKVRMPNGVEINPFTAWVTVTQPNSQLMPDDVINACELAIGQLESRADLAESSSAGSLDLAATHSLIWNAARALWQSGHYRQSVEAAYGALLDHVKQRLGRSANSDDSAVFSQAFSKSPPDPTAARLRWPGNPEDRTVKSMNQGILHFSMGVQFAIRNSSIHRRDELTAQEGGERLAALSLLMSWIDQCESKDAAQS